MQGSIRFLSRATLIVRTSGIVLTAARVRESNASVTHERSAYLVISPLGGSPRWISSAPRFHDMRSPYTESYGSFGGTNCGYQIFGLRTSDAITGNTFAPHRDCTWRVSAACDRGD